MLLSLPILHLARVNPLLLHYNKQAAFIQLPAFDLAGAVKPFLSFLLAHFYLDPCFPVKETQGSSFLSVIQKHKRRGMI